MKRLAILISLLLTVFTVAQNFNDALRLSGEGLGANARALGMGDAFHAVSDDYSAMYFNPAGLAQIRRMEMAGSFDYNSYSNSVNLLGNSVDSDENALSIGEFGMVVPLPTMRGSIVLGLAYTRDRNFTRIYEFDGFNSNGTTQIENLTMLNNPIAYELYLNDYSNEDGHTTKINGNLNQSGKTLQEGYTGKWAFSGAAEVARNLYAGFSLNMLTGEFESDKRYYEDDTRNFYGSSVQLVDGNSSTSDFRTFHLNDIIKWDITGFDFKVGLLYNHFNRFRVGLAVKTPSQYTITETYTIDSYSEFAARTYTYPTYTEEIEYDIETPYEFTAAGAVNLFPVMLSGEVTYIDYSEMEFTDGFGDAGELVWRNQEIKDLMKSVFNMKTGIEFNIASLDTRLRGGFIYKPSAFDGDPSEYDKKYITAGVGFLPNDFISVDAGYAYGWWDSITDNYGDPGTSRGEETITTNKFVLSVSYRY